MAGHGIFITVMLSAAANGFSNVELEPFEVLFSLLPASWTVDGFLKSQLFAIAVLFCSHLVSFYREFICTGEYNITVASDYMIHPYRRIDVMHITIIPGFFTMFFSGLRGAAVIIIWAGMKVITDLLMNISDEARRKRLKEEKEKPVPAESARRVKK
jgi:hypothetical protein